MATHLRGPERVIINQLIDQNVFTSHPTPKTTQVVADAMMAFKKTVVQQHVNNYLTDLVGQRPENYQENLVWLVGPQQESPEAVHVLLATLKAVINLPELQGNRADRAVLVQTIVRQVHSEVVDLDEREIHRLITALFVDRFNLFVPDLPEYTPSDQEQEITEYWDVSPDFNLVAQALVNRLMAQTGRPPLTAVQRLNRLLLSRRYLSRATLSPQLWATLLQQKEAIAAQWAELQRFDLECGDDYALLLDTTRQPSKAKPSVVAIAVARRIGVGIPADKLTQTIRQVAATVLPDYPIVPTLVKQALLDFGLVTIQHEFVSPTPLVQRFAVGTQAEEE